MFNGTLHPYQEEPKNRFKNRGSLLLAFGCGTGKFQPVSEPVLTPDGWKEIGQLKIGDYVTGKDGKPTRVTGVFPQTDRTVYKVTMNDGSWTYAGPEHLWSVRQKVRDGWQVKTTKEILDSGLTIPRKTLDKRLGGRSSDELGYKYQIPVVDPVSYEKAEIPVDPYLVGLLLGDGSIKYGTVGLTTADPELLETIGPLLPEGLTIKHDSGYSYRFSAGRGNKNNLLTDLRNLGLQGKGCEDKFIPEVYLRSSVEDRLSLLQGLMDTDGSVDKRQGTAEFYTISEYLKDGIVELVQSLGGIARVKLRETNYYWHNGEKKIGQPCYRVAVKLPKGLVPFRLTRKRVLYKEPEKYQPDRRIKTIEYSHEEDSVCISVAAEDQLYITRNYIVTHNTVIAIAAAEELAEEGYIGRCLILCPASLKYQWANSIKNFTDSPCLVIDGTKDERLQQYASASIGYIITSYDSVLYDYDNLAKLDVDMIICDEVTAIKSFKAQRSKKVKKLFKDVPYRLGLTATPIENKPEELYSIMQWVDSTVLGRYDLFEKSYVVRNKNKWITGYKNLDTLHERMGSALARKTRQDPDVRPYLPEVDDGKWPVEMHKEIRSVYKVIAADMIAELEELKNVHEHVDVSAYYSGVDESTPPGRLMAMHMCMEMLLDHPDLLIWSGQEYGKPDSKFGCEYAYNIWQSGALDKITSSSKLEYLKNKISDIIAEPSSKIIIFSKYKFMLTLIADALPCKSVMFHGEMNAKAKEHAKEIFKTDPDCRVFLSSYAGGYGQDLNMADYLINYDLPWSFGQQDQINSRHIRASSEFDKVYIRNLVTEDSIEERKLRMLERKRTMSDAVIDGNGSSEVSTDNDQLKTHLEFFLEGS